MTYALIENGAIKIYPYSFAQLRTDNPDVSFPRDLSKIPSEYGFVPVAEIPRPSPSNPLTKNVVEATPVLVGTKWTQTWEEFDAPAEQVALRQEEQREGENRTVIKADNFVQAFINMSPAEVTAYIDANVTNLQSAKNVINKLALMVLLLARREFR